jgi:hypothetical protein
MGHRDYKTTLIYADYAPRAEERQMMERAFDPIGGEAGQHHHVSRSTAIRR